MQIIPAKYSYCLQSFNIFVDLQENALRIASPYNCYIIYIVQHDVLIPRC